MIHSGTGIIELAFLILIGVLVWPHVTHKKKDHHK